MINFKRLPAAFFDRLNATLLFSLILLFSLGLTVGATLWGTYQIKKELAREREENLRTLLRHTAQIIKPHVKLMVRSEIERVAEELLSFEFVKGVRIVWTEPSVLKEIREMDLLLGRTPKAPAELEVTKGDFHGEILSWPIVDGKEILGRLEIAIDDTSHERLIARLLERFLLVGLAVSLAVSGLLYLYYRLVSQPLLDLAQHMKRAGQELAPFSLVAAPQEIRALVDSYNQLVLNLKRYRQELKEMVERWQQEAQRAEAASRAKTAFLANVTHELRTPLTGALGMAELLEEARLSPKEREYLENLRASLKNLSELIEEVLDFSRLEAERETLRSEVFDFKAFLREIEGFWRPHFEQKGLSWKVSSEEKVPRFLEGDVTKLRQILFNLLSNALKFTSSGGVKLSVDLEDQATQTVRLHFRVEDTGCGLAKEDLERIFVPFERLHQETPGTGLGLSISRHLAKLMGGDLRAESPGPGQGAVFHLLLPLRKVTPSQEPKARGASSFSGRVLLAEDNPVTRHFLLKVLEKFGLQVIAVEDGKQAFNLARKETFDLLFLDLRMPGLDGLEVARRLRALGYRGVIIALTAHALSEMEQESLRAGMDGFVTKPVTREKLARVLRDWLGEGRDLS